MPFKLGQTYKDRNGVDIKIICADSPLVLRTGMHDVESKNYPLIGLRVATGHAFYYTLEGEIAYGGNCPPNLIPPEPVRCQMKVYQYRDFRGGLVLTEGPLSEGWFLAMARQFEANRQKGCTEQGLITTIERILEG